MHFKFKSCVRYKRCLESRYTYVRELANRKMRKILIRKTTMVEYLNNAFHNGMLNQNAMISK